MKAYELPTKVIHKPIPVVHASAVYTDNGAWIFLGPSGTGKSTICHLLSAHARPLANEAVYLIRGADGGWSVAGADAHAYEGPTAQAEGNALDAVPLRAILRLFQATAPRLARIDAPATCRYLTDALFEIAWQREYDVATKKTLFSDLAAVCRTTPGYEFHFDLTPQTFDVLNESIELGESSTNRIEHK